MPSKPTYEELAQRVKDLEQELARSKNPGDNLTQTGRIIDPLYESAGLGIFRSTLEGRFLDLNPALAQMLGYDSPREVMDSIYSIPEQIYVEPTRRDELINQLLKQGKTIKEENRYRRRDGTEWTAYLHLRCVLDSNGKPVCLEGFVEDITERKVAEERLNLFRQVVADATDAIGISTVDGMHWYQNVAFDSLFGKIGDDLPATLYCDTDIGREVFETIMAGGEWSGEVQMHAADGRVLDIFLRAYAFTDENGQILGLVGVHTDISELKRMEETKLKLQDKLYRSKKMESLGLLAGGVAHDLNNILSGIVSWPEIILMDLPENSEFRDPIEQILKAGHNAASIVNDLITVARGVATPKEPLNLNNTIRDYLNSRDFQNLEAANPGVTVNIRLDPGLLNIRGSQIHLKKIIMNLVSNAMEAIEKSGSITISTVNNYLDTPLRNYEDISVGEYVVFAVSNTGSGISSEDLERIFEPFYTKKVMGRSGTGLGLTVVWNAVQDHDGYIDVISDSNGVTFKLYLPITREALFKKELSLSITRYKGNGERVLVVDDQENQREISCKMLNVLGYKTVAVSSGEKAAEYLSEHSADLLLLDMIMDPGINGRETYERIKKINPDQKAIIVSGFAETNDVKKAQELGAGKYLKKPLTIEKLGIAVKAELEK